jgi:transcriptional regulator
MHIPAQFAETDVAVLHDLIRNAGAATLVTLTGQGAADGMEANHLPLLLDPDDGPNGALLGHFARANPQWRRFDPKVPALAIFTGPEAYVSPSWYPGKAEHGKAVPTWNFIAVHVYGALEILDDAAQTRDIVARLTDRHEAGRAEPWRVDDAPVDYLQAMLKGIVGFRLRIDRLEGKRKLSQNRSAEDQAGVIAGLRRHGGAQETATADAMTPPPPV